MEEVLTVRTDAATRRSPEFEADLVRLRAAVTRLQDSMTSPTSLLHREFMKRVLGFSYHEVHTTRQVALTSLLTTVVYLVPPVVATTVTLSWAGAPVWTWLGVAVLMGAFELFAVRVESESSAVRRDLMRLPAAIDRDVDLHELVDFTRRWWRIRVFAPAAVVLATLVVGASAAAAPDALRGVHVGTLTMAALLVHEYVEAQLAVSLVHRFFVRESRYMHRLSWLDPLASPPVQAVLHTWFVAVGAGSPMLVITALALAILLIPASPGLLVALLAGVALVGLVLILTSLISLRRSVQRIVQHSKDAALESLRVRIEALEPRFSELTPDESARLRALLATYAAVRDAPTGPSGSQTLVHAATALAVPAITLLLAVMSEVYAERLLDQLLP